MFKYFNQFMSADPNGLDVLIMDEAHRIREDVSGPVHARRISNR